MSPVALQSVVLLWLFALGGAIGSFLNVVIYRLPAGLSIVRPGSHCPVCKHPIRWYDNLPILSWFVLRGRCRDCRESFSIRYALVEAATAVLFVVLGELEGFSWGTNLPASPAVAEGSALPALLGVGQTAGILAYHLLLLATLLAAAMIEYDGHRVPLRLMLPALAAGALAPLVWPHLHPVAASPGLTGWQAGLTDGAAGLAAGAAFGIAAEPLYPSRDPGRAMASACVGLFLGWQAACALGVIVLVVCLLMAALRRFVSGRPCSVALACLGLAALLWIVNWAHLVARWPVLG